MNSFSIDHGFATKIKTISFSPKSPFCGPRILLASPTTVHIFSALLETPSFHASILNAASPSVSLQSAIFLTIDEVLLIPELAPRLTIRNLVTGFGVELRDVKHTNSTRRSEGKILSYSIRKKSGHVAFLTRPSVGKDVVVILSPQQDQNNGTRIVELEFPVTTSDAIGLLFSPDGAWLAILDSAPAGVSHEPTNGPGGAVYIYTPTGKLYRQWKGSSESQDPELDLGVERIEWIADNRLAIATVDGRVVILAARTFEEESVIRHPTIFHSIPNSANIFVEEIAPGDGTRSYAPATLPAAPPSETTGGSTGNEVPPRGITHLAVSPDGSTMASVSAHTPTTVHMTDLQRGHVETRSILIHHGLIRTIEWHSVHPGWLLIRTVHERSRDMDTVYIWGDSLSEPLIVKASIPQDTRNKSSARDGLVSSSTTSRNVSPSWIISTLKSHTDSIPHILFSFPTLALSLSAFGNQDSNITRDSTFLESKSDETPTSLQQSTSSNKLAQKTPIRGHGPEDAFDESFEQLRAESLAQSISESVTDDGFSPVKFDATDWTRRQILGQDIEDDDDTFIGKGKRR